MHFERTIWKAYAHSESLYMAGSRRVLSVNVSLFGVPRRKRIPPKWPRAGIHVLIHTPVDRWRYSDRPRASPLFLPISAHTGFPFLLIYQISALPLLLLYLLRFRRGRRHYRFTLPRLYGKVYERYSKLTQIKFGQARY